MQISIDDVSELFNELEKEFPLTFKKYHSENAASWFMKIQEAKLTNESLALGMKLLVSEGRGIPPNCGEFINICKKTKKTTVNASHKSGYSLPAPNVSEEDVKKHRENLKTKITGYSDIHNKQKEERIDPVVLSNPDSKDYFLMRYLLELGSDISVARRLIIIRGET